MHKAGLMFFSFASLIQAIVMRSRSRFFNEWLKRIASAWHIAFDSRSYSPIHRSTRNSRLVFFIALPAEKRTMNNIFLSFFCPSLLSSLLVSSTQIKQHAHFVITVHPSCFVVHLHEELISFLRFFLSSLVSTAIGALLDQNRLHNLSSREGEREGEAMREHEGK